MLAYLYVLPFTSLQPLYGTLYCATKEKFLKAERIISKIDTVVTLFIPTVIIVGSNIRIGLVLKGFYQRQAMFTRGAVQAVEVSRPSTATQHRSFRRLLNSTTAQDTEASEQHGGIYANTASNRMHMRITRMLLVVSCVFVACHVPSHMLRVVYFIKKSINKDYVPSHIFQLLNKLFLFIYHLNFATNFLLYALASDTFRKALGRMCSRMKPSATQAPPVNPDAPPTPAPQIIVVRAHKNGSRYTV